MTTQEIIELVKKHQAAKERFHYWIARARIAKNQGQTQIAAGYRHDAVSALLNVRWHRRRLVALGLLISKAKEAA